MSYIDDIRNWMSEALPVAGHWNVGGFAPDWHFERTKAGNRSIPSIKINLLTNMEVDSSGLPKATPPLVKQENIDFLNANGLPITLRTDNIASTIVSLPRLDVTMENIPNSPVVYTLVDGVLNDEGLSDNFGPVSIWKNAGENWGKCRYMSEIQKRHPNIPYFILAHNNEVGYELEGNYIDSTTDVNGKIAYTPYGTRIYKWKNNLQEISVRVRDFAVDHTPAEFLKTFYQNQNNQYNALYEGFDSQLDVWKGKMLRESYKVARTFCNGGKIEYCNQYESQLNHYNGGGTSIYNSAGKFGVFTSSDIFSLFNCIPIFDKEQALDPKAFREVFVGIGGGAVYKGFKDGKHELMTPDLYTGYLKWMMWSLKGIRTPMMLRYWNDSKTKPTSKIVNSTKDIETVKTLGLDNILTLTEEDYYKSAMDAVNAICENPILRKFWQDGKPLTTGKHPENAQRLGGAMKTPVVYPMPEDEDNRWRLIECNLNTPYNLYIEGRDQPHYNPNLTIKVWSLAIKLEDQILVYAWTPCKLTGQMTLDVPEFGIITVDVPTFEACYLLTQERQVVITAPKKIERIL